MKKYNYTNRNKVKPGERYGKLITINKISNDSVSWACLCNCGKEKILSENDLLSGHDKSCGFCRKENRYKFYEDYAIIYLDSGNTFVINKNKYNLIKKYKWRENDEGYIYAFTDSGKIYVHRLVMGLKSYEIDKITIDHIDRNKKNNRNNNLRLATKTQNKRNGNIRKDNQTGIAGVGWYKKYNKWVAFIAVNKIDKNLGYYENFNDAIIARLKAEKEYFGEFAPQRHLFKEYGIE